MEIEPEPPIVPSIDLTGEDDDDVDLESVDLLNRESTDPTPESGHFRDLDAFLPI